MQGKSRIKILMCIVTASVMFQLAAIWHYIDYFDIYGYLPMPFIYDKHDTFMDFYNVLYWAGESGRYTEWNSVYPPINFLFLQFVSWILLGPTNGLDAFKLRELGVVPVFICVGYFLFPLLALRCKPFVDFKLWQKSLFYLFAITGAPFLYALERGNLILITSLFLALVFSDSRLVRVSVVAILINIKPYFALLLLVPVAQRQWSEAIKTGLAAGSFFVATGLLLGGDFLSFFSNLIGFGQSDNVFSLREVMNFPASISAFSYLFKSPAFSMGASQSIAALAATAPTAVELAKVSLLTIILALVLVKGRAFGREELVALMLTLITNIGVSIGGYSLLFYFVLIPVFIKMRYWGIYVLIICLLFLPLDAVTLLDEPIGRQLAYLSGEWVSVTWSLGIGSLIRPLINFLLLILIGVELAGRTIKMPASVPNI